MKLLCIDGNSVISRAFYGLKLLSTKDGRFTNAIVGFMNIFLKLIEQEQPDAVAIAFDLPEKTFRHKMYEGYKAGRSPTPQELKEQLPVVQNILTLIGYKIITCAEYEADDIIGTLAAGCKKADVQCVIASGDRDGQQLIGSGVEMLLTVTKFGKSETTLITPETIMEKYGVIPEQLIDVKALAGDASDKIPGVAGVGEVTACKLISVFSNLEGIYENIDNEIIKPGVREKLLRDKEQAFLSRELATINCNAPIPLDINYYKKQPGNHQEAVALLQSLELQKLLLRLGLDTVKMVQKADVPIADALKSGRVDKTEKKLYFVNDEEILCSDGKVLEVIDPTGQRLAELLSSPAKKMFFDAKYFFRFALENNIDITGAEFDAKLAAYLLNPGAKEYHLCRIASEYGIAGTEISEVLPAVFEYLNSELSRNGMMTLLTDIELPLSEVLASMEYDGFCVDRQGIVEFGAGIETELLSITDEIYEGVGYQFNINSPKQLGVALFEKMGLPTRKKTKQGYSTDAKTLESLSQYSPVIEKILQYRSLQKLLSTYVEGLQKQIEADGRIHTIFKQTETRTGRISSIEPNLQNIPIRTEKGRELRRFFVASPGKILIDADYSQIELRILAALSDDKNMKEAFLSGEDIHRTTAAKVFDVPPIMVTPSMRRSAKAVNFGIVYGIGAFSLAKDIGVSVKEADGFIKNYLCEFSGVEKYLIQTVDDAKKNGFVTTFFGRRRIIPELRAQNQNIQKLGERMAMNTPIQGTAADIIKIAMVRVYKRLKTEKLDAKLILQVHDELLVEASEGLTVQVKHILEQEMQAAASLAVPMVAEVSYGATWLDAH